MKTNLGSQYSAVIAKEKYRDSAASVESSIGLRLVGISRAKVFVPQRTKFASYVTKVQLLDSGIDLLYGIFVLDLKIIKWETIHSDTAPGTVIPLRGAKD